MTNKQATDLCIAAQEAVIRDVEHEANYCREAAIEMRGESSEARWLLRAETLDSMVRILKNRYLRKGP